MPGFGGGNKKHYDKLVEHPKPFTPLMHSQFRSKTNASSSKTAPKAKQSKNKNK